MFNEFKNQKKLIKEKELGIQRPKMNYMLAEEARELAYQSSIENIFQTIYMSVNNGKTSVKFIDKNIRAGHYQLLKDLGYKVKIYISDLGQPCFEVSW